MTAHYTGFKPGPAHDRAVAEGRDYFVVELYNRKGQTGDCHACVPTAEIAKSMSAAGYCTTWQTVRAVSIGNAIARFDDAQIQMMGHIENVDGWEDPDVSFAALYPN